MPASSVASARGRATALRLVMCIGGAVLGGYVVVWGLIATLTSSLFALGMAFHDAEFLASALGLLTYLVVFLWVFTVRRLALACLVLVGSGALMAALGSLLQSALI